MAKQFTCSKDKTVVTTKQGKIRGFQFDGIYTFHGIKYADAKRFQMPTEIEPYEGVKDALAYGYCCPMLHQDQPSMEVFVPHRYWPMDERCQYLNIWSPSLEKDAKKPVMVWLHGGGYSSGSSIEHICYEGDHLSQYGDVVVVSLNHRLNILGYLDLSAYGEKYKNSGNAGNADIVMALKWIHDNIAAFGGDPENVTLFGQSGGGMKVYNMMNTPEADGLFHKGIIQSGVADTKLVTEGDASYIIEALLKELKIKKKDIAKLETIPYAQLAEAYNKVAPALAEEGKYVGNGPIANEWYVGDPREVGFTEHAKTIPVMIGTVFGEFDFGQAREGRSTMTRKAALAQLEKHFGKDTKKIVQLYEAAYPGKKLIDLDSIDTFFRPASIDFVEKKAKHPESPVYSYQFTFEFPLEEGKPAWHCSEIPYVFHNSDRAALYNVPGVTDILEERLSGAWVNFARYGNPNVGSLPAWPACEPGVENVMILDRKCEVRVNFDHALLKLVEKYAQNPFDKKKEEEDEEEKLLLH